MQDWYKTPPLKCDVCGRFVSHHDLSLGLAVRMLEAPDNAFGPERWLTLCADCTRKEKADAGA